MFVAGVYAFQRAPGLVRSVGPELGHPDRTFRQEDDQQDRGDGGEREERHVDGLPLERGAYGGGEQNARGEEHAVQRQQRLSVRRVRYFRYVHDDHGRHAWKSKTVLENRIARTSYVIAIANHLR